MTSQSSQNHLSYISDAKVNRNFHQNFRHMHVSDDLKNSQLGKTLKMNPGVSSQRNGNSANHCPPYVVPADDCMIIDGSTTETVAGENLKVYQRDDLNEKKSTKLHVHYMKTKILDAISAQRIVIIKGETGCGKTTQIPQFILDAAKENNQPCNIVVTQPRRIAAITVATRVAFERKCPLGTLVGYQIGLDKKVNKDTRILYMTTGVLLQKLISRKNLDEYTHYIIDEIHERNHDMDFLLIVLRHFLNLKSKGEAKLIVMSATINEEKIRNYLIMYYNQIPFEPSVINITHKTQFEVRIFFVDDLKSRIKEARNLCSFELDCPEIAEYSYKTAARIIQELDNIDRNEEDSDRVLGERPAVLVFLPGIHEIEMMEKILKEISSPEQNNSFWVKPLHSSITAEEQQAVFRNPPESKRKIILSTNIAESSVTVTDIKYVIDFCLTKSLVTDQVTGCTSLALEWAPKSSLKQRAGRVGRIASGRVYRMITSQFYDDELSDEAIPEILRCPLETLVLKAKLLDMGKPRECLELAIDPPDLRNLFQAVAHLKQMGALLVCVGNEYDDSDGDLTLLGEVIAYLPVDVRLGKLIFLGAMLGVPEECIIMACAMATKNLFSTPYGENLKAYEMKLWWADSTSSDCFAFLNAYKAWRERRSNLDVKTSQMSELAAKYYFQLNALKELANLEEEVKRRLKNFNFSIFEKPRLERSTSIPYRSKSTDDKLFFIKLAIAGAFYPNYFVRSSSGTQDEERQALNTLGGHDPLSTVYLLGLPQNQPTVIYRNAIKKQFRNITERLNVNVDNGSKAYVTFHSAISPPEKGKIPGKIEMAIYRAVKMRQVNVKVTIPVIRNDEATNIYNKYLNQKKCTAPGVDPELRKILDKLVWPWQTDQMKRPREILEIEISHIESPQRFWIRSSLNNSKIAMEKMHVILNVSQDVNVLVKLPSDADLTIGSLFVASPFETKVFYRCRIVDKKRIESKKDIVAYTYTVFFIDHGSSRTDLLADDIYDIDPLVKECFFVDKLPDFAVECSLVKIRPKSRNSNENPSHNGWSNEAIRIFRRMFISSSSIAKVYSVVNDVLRVKVVIPNLKNSQYTWQSTINYLLVEEGYAEEAHEDYISICKRDELKKFISLPENIERIRECYGEDRDEGGRGFANINRPVNVDVDDLELPENFVNGTQTILKGPFSPLEMQVSSMIRDRVGMPVRIESDSVNSVLLDTDPSDPKEKMLVAAFVGMNPTQDRLILRHTTMMPNIRALPMLCCLLFAPMVELKVNPSSTRYSGALCGLGYDRKTKKSLFPAGDLSVVFDCEIVEEELQLINRLRHRLNGVFNPMIELSVENLDERAQALRDGLKKLFFESTYELQPTYHSTKPFDWGLVRSGKLRNPMTNDGPEHPAEDFRTVHRLIWAVWRTGNADKEREHLLSGLKMLENFSEGNSSRKIVECPLCGTSLSEVPSAKMHLKTATHRARFKRYRQHMAAFSRAAENDVQIIS